jgi:hypothetical protein
MSPKKEVGSSHVDYEAVVDALTHDRLHVELVT